MSSTQDETITQQVTSEEQESSASTEEQTLASSSQEQSVTADELDSIPQKFVGKSASDILRAYLELEKDTGRVRSEVGSVRKEHEELQEKYRQLERERLQYQPISTQALRSQENSQAEELDPISVFDSKFDEDPKAAIREALRLQNESQRAESTKERLQRQSLEATNWYQTQKKENQDFARREALMRQAAEQFGALIKDEYANSTQALQALDILSRGMDVDYYRKQAVESAKKDGLSSREEKRRAHSESTSSNGDTSVKVSDMSLADMEKLFGFADK